MTVDVLALRKRLAWSQTDMARFLCVADSTIARWEAGDRVPTGRTGDDLAALERAAATTANPSLVRAIKDAASRGETIKTLTQRALEGLARKDGKRAE